MDDLLHNCSSISKDMFIQTGVSPWGMAVVLTSMHGDGDDDFLTGKESSLFFPLPKLVFVRFLGWL